MATFTYGRLRPLHVNGMLFGWLLAADMGLTYYVVPRLCGVKLWSEKLGVATAVLWNVIILGAVVSPAGGMDQGLEYAELPMPLDILVVVAWVMFGVNIFGTIASRRYQQMYVTHLVHHGHHPVDGVRLPHRQLRDAVRDRRQPGEPELDVRAQRRRPDLHAGRARVAYYFIPRSSNRRCHSHKLSMIGFWSLAFVYVWTGAHHMLHGPISQWLQTIAIAFSVMLLIPVWSVVYNLFATMKGQWHETRENVPLKFLMSGVVFYLLTCFQGPMHSLRSVNAIVSKTDWIPGPRAHGGAGRILILRNCGHLLHLPAAVPDANCTPSRWRNWSYWFLMSGGLGFFVTLWLGGFWQGWQWNNPSIPFIDTVIALGPVWLVRFFSGVLMFVGIICFAYNVMATALGREESGGGVRRRPMLQERIRTSRFAVAASLGDLLHRRRC